MFTLTVTTTPKAWPRNHELASATRHVRAALGLHPQLVAERAHEIGLWEELLPRTRYVGEVGLDAGPRFYRSFETQKEIFARVLTLCAAAGNKIVTTHSVRATKAVLDMIEQHMPPLRQAAVGRHQPVREGDIGASGGHQARRATQRSALLTRRQGTGLPLPLLLPDRLRESVVPHKLLSCAKPEPRNQMSQCATKWKIAQSYPNLRNLICAKGLQSSFAAIWVQ